MRADTATEEVVVTATRHTVNGQTVDAGAVTTIGGIVGTRRAGGAPWQPVLGSDPTERGHVRADDVEAFTHDNALARWGDGMVANTVMTAR